MRASRPGLINIVVAGLVAGALDIAYACLFWSIKANVSPLRILQSVAAGVLGDASYKGGMSSAALGFALHFLIAIAMAATYFVAAARFQALVRRPFIFGFLYGLCLYALMNYVVVPLSAAAPGSADPLWKGLSMLVHMLLVGVPIALLARRARC
jgi:uncharacterized membrane protein YagU involved in acid resistance